jgi:hypothetical protein
MPMAREANSRMMLNLKSPEAPSTVRCTIGRGYNLVDNSVVQERLVFVIAIVRARFRCAVIPKCSCACK